MFITGLGTALPTRFTQQQCWEAAQVSAPFQQLSARGQAIVKAVLLGEPSVATRHFGVESVSELFEGGPDELHARFTRNAPVLAAEAAACALTDGALDASAIDAVIVSTCTGYLCPGLTSYVSERLGLRRDVLALDLVGQGCGAALPNLRTAEALLASGRCGCVLSVCVEVCSAAFYGDEDPGVLISACLFGDGAAAAVLSASPNRNHRRIEWKTTGSILNPEHRDYLRFETEGGMLRNILTQPVPELAGKYAEQLFSDVMAKHGAARGQIAAWIMHAGGRDVLMHLRKMLALTEEDLRWSAAVLRDCGNLSSPFVLFVLHAALGGNAPGGLWWMSSFGAGFSCHGALLEVE